MNHRKNNDWEKKRIRDLWNNFKWLNIHVIGIPEKEEREGVRYQYLKKW